jgi:hypothetical protein
MKTLFLHIMIALALTSTLGCSDTSQESTSAKLKANCEEDFKRYEKEMMQKNFNTAKTIIAYCNSKNPKIYGKYFKEADAIDIVSQTNDATIGTVKRLQSLLLIEKIYPEYISKVTISKKELENKVAYETLGKQWKYSANEDSMTGKLINYANLDSTNTVEFSFPYNKPQIGTLELRSHPRHGKDVMFSIERGQILCNSFRDCTVLVRLNNGAPETFSAVSPSDNSSNTIFIRGYDRFMNKLKKANIIRISVNIYQEGAPVFEFNASGFKPEKFLPNK